jgi:hypothetical protein
VPNRIFGLSMTVPPRRRRRAADHEADTEIEELHDSRSAARAVSISLAGRCVTGGFGPPTPQMLPPLKRLGVPSTDVPNGPRRSGPFVAVTALKR